MMKIGSMPEMIRRFRRDERGNFLMLFGLVLVPLMGVVGVAIDYSRASNARQALNSAIDSAALMAARDAQKMTDKDLTKRVDDWVKDNLPPDVKSQFSGSVITIDRTARTIKIDASANVPTTISSVLGMTKLPVSTSSQSTWGTNKIELALVLDNTGSMSGAKMTALKQASKDLIKIMKDASIDPEQIKISIVPFNTQVRIDRGFKDESWIKYGRTRSVTMSYDSKSKSYKTPTGVDESDSTISGCSTNSRGVRTCKEAVSKPKWAATEGCIADRDKNYDVTDGGSYGASAQQYPAAWCSYPTLAEIKPLTNDWDALNTHIDTMSAVGNTNITIGAAWGWATLTQVAPFTNAKLKTEPRLKKYMILLTDGDNTENGAGDSTSTIDARTKLACTNVKADGVSLYTIRVIDGNESLLKSCASAPEMYYNVKNASELSPVFQAIAKEISAVRLTQ